MITIAPVRLADAADLILANRESRAHHAPWASPFVDRDGFEAWFGGLRDGRAIGLLARETDTGGIVGVIDLSQIVMGRFESAYLGYYGMARFAGRGMMTEAVRLAVRLAFDQIGLHRLEANIQPGNAASIALAKRAGFHKEGFSPRYLRIDGVWRDHERWALLSDAPPG